MSVELKEEQIRPVSLEVEAVMSELPTVIQTDADAEAGNQWLAVIRTKRKRVDDFFKELVKPFQSAVKAHNAKRDEILKPLQDREQTLIRSLTEYRNKKRQEAEEKARREQEKYEKRMAKAEEKGKDVSTVAPPKIVEAPASTQAGVTYRKITKWAVDDEKRVPEQYWCLDEAKIGKAVRAGVEIPGIRTWQEEAPAVRG